LADGLAGFNALPAAEAQAALRACLADSQWAARVAGGRPFRDLPQLLARAEAEWARLTPADWLAAFSAHPRIGERGGGAASQSEREQSGVRRGDSQTLAALAAGNRAYEAKFGHVFLIAAAGRSAAEILAALEARLQNDPETELAAAIGEQRKITRLRLGRLLSE
jgi:OHCU decarboxylase